MLTASKEILGNICFWLGITILLSSAFLPDTSLARRYIPDFCKRHLIALGGALIAGLALFISSVTLLNLKTGLLLLGIIIGAFILAIIHYILRCHYSKK